MRGSPRGKPKQHGTASSADTGRRAGTGSPLSGTSDVPNAKLQLTDLTQRAGEAADPGSRRRRD